MRLKNYGWRSVKLYRRQRTKPSQRKQKAGSQEIPGVTGKISLGEEKEAGQKLIEFCQGNALIIANTLFNNTRDEFTHGHHQMGNMEIKLITFFVAKDRKAVYNQQKQDLELTVAQIISFS